MSPWTVLNTSALLIQSGIASGKSSQSDAIKASNEADLLRNQIAEQQAHLPSLRAALNAAIGRNPAAVLTPAISIPPNAKIMATEDKLRQRASEVNPEVAGADIHAREEAVRLAKLQYVPDFSLGVSTDLGGNIQNLLGSLTVPVLRYEAINAAVAQAQANLRASDAMRQQARLNLQSRVIADVTILHGIERQLSLFDGAILPRARQNALIIRSSYENNRATISDAFDSQRSVIAIERLKPSCKSHMKSPAWTLNLPLR